MSSFFQWCTLSPFFHRSTISPKYSNLHWSLYSFYEPQRPQNNSIGLCPFGVVVALFFNDLLCGDFLIVTSSQYVRYVLLYLTSSKDLKLWYHYWDFFWRKKHGSPHKLFFSFFYELCFSFSHELFLIDSSIMIGTNQILFIEKIHIIK